MRDFNFLYFKLLCALVWFVRSFLWGHSGWKRWDIALVLLFSDVFKTSFIFWFAFGFSLVLPLFFWWWGWSFVDRWRLVLVLIVGISALVWSLGAWRSFPFLLRGSQSHKIDDLCPVLFWSHNFGWVFCYSYRRDKLWLALTCWIRTRRAQPIILLLSLTTWLRFLKNQRLLFQTLFLNNCCNFEGKDLWGFPFAFFNLFFRRAFRRLCDFDGRCVTSWLEVGDILPCIIFIPASRTWTS